MQTLELTQASLRRQDAELIATAISENPIKETKLISLNLSRNNSFGKEGVKMLTTALEINKTIQNLDLSRCALGVSGFAAIAEALKKNTSIKAINLFGNKGDVDGARALREALKVNKTLEFLDVGYNRLREKGIRAITEGFTAN